MKFNTSINDCISVIMGVYNCSKTIERSIHSIINQTYNNWELIICDDGSTDNTYSLALNFKNTYPQKIILLKNKNNCGLSYTLNRCLKRAKGYYIARMDGDDFSQPNRFDKQIEWLKKNPNSDLVGTAMQCVIDSKYKYINYSVTYPNRNTLKSKMPFHHATILTYKYVYDTLKGYTVSKSVLRCEDSDLWFRFYKAGFTGMNIPDPLYVVYENLDTYKRRTIKSRIIGLFSIYKGFKLLQYPLLWYLIPLYRTILKVILPYQVYIFNNKLKIKVRNYLQSTKRKYK